ncbi:YjjG family noncanonical pyrimidine nucleotidase [uncultured Draconibacterium sp.]|uniref:YjjG family noncanonical pyrimidine nucleotidase n=1 Tax=uncultured Draconibacterium sp. TaxID=1573823 RepID=UPI003217940C
MNKKYTHLFFDLDNTLWDFKQNSKLTMEITFHAFGIGNQNRTFEEFFEVYSEINHFLWAAYRKKEISKKELTRKRFQLTFDQLQITGIDSDEMNSAYLAEMPKQKVLEPGTLDVLEYLKQERYKLFIITNGFSEVQHKKLHSSGLAPFFEKVFISEELKCPKPGHLIFEHAIKSSNAKKGRSLMIGDDWDVDVIGALKFGIDSVYYSAEKRGIMNPRSNKYKNTLYYFTHLLELKTIL